MPKYALIQMDDWTVLYKDGLKIDENHSLDLEEVLKEVAPDTEFFWFEEDELDSEWEVPTLERAREKYEESGRNKS